MLYYNITMYVREMHVVLWYSSYTHSSFALVCNKNAGSVRKYEQRRGKQAKC